MHIRLNAIDGQITRKFSIKSLAKENPVTQFKQWCILEMRLVANEVKIWFWMQLGVWRTKEHQGLFKSHLHYVTLFMYWHQATTHYSTKAMLYNINMLEHVSSIFSSMLWQIYCTKVKIKQLISWLSEREWWDEKALTGTSVQHQGREHPLNFLMAVDSLLFQTSNCKQLFYSIYRLRMTPWHLPYKESKNCSCVFPYEHSPD